MPECRVVFENRLPDYWQATITNIAAVFYYKRPDESELEAYAAQKAVNLGTNQTDQLDSNDPAKCVGKVYAAVAVRIPGHPDGKADKTAANVPGTCTDDVRIILQPKPGVASIKNVADLDIENAFDIQIFGK
jgi:hypothetical protein